MNDRSPINPAIFRAYDIRGVVEQDLDDATLWTIGRAVGTWFVRHDAHELVVGRDERLSSPAFQMALIEGLRASGIDVVDIGAVPTPVMYFAVEHCGADGGLVVTASHNPPEYNGVKLRRAEPRYGSVSVWGPDIQEIEQLARSGDVADGSGTLRTRDVSDAYVASVAALLRLPDECCAEGSRPRVVLDGGNGVAGPIAQRTLTAVGAEVIPLYLEPDGRFPNHHPDPLKTDNLRDLSRLVRESGADMGLALDGDGDRLGVVDASGRVVWADRYLIVLAHYLLAQSPGRAVVFDIKCSSVLADAIASFGGKPERWKTGYASIAARMRETDAVLGGELSGHTFATYPRHAYDDGTFAGAHLLRALCQMGQQQGRSGMLPLAEALAPYPMLPSLKDERLRFTDTTKFQVVEHVRQHFAGQYPLLTVDGVHVDFGDGWGVVRASNTEPVITTGFEAVSEERLHAIYECIMGVVNAFRTRMPDEMGQ